MAHIQPQVYFVVNRRFLFTAPRSPENQPMVHPTGQIIRQRLTALQKNQSWLAERLGVSINAVSKWIRVGKISRANAIKAARALEITVDALIGPTHAATALAESTPRYDINSGDGAQNAREGIMLHLFRGLAETEQLKIVKEMRAAYDTNRMLLEKFGVKQLRGVTDEQIERAFGKAGLPATPAAPAPGKPSLRRNPDVDPAAGDMLDQ